ncbi:hypothetical protein POM88_016063 [Heracleum sosnowskyi]|uniref:Transposase n=1 Tax=Heracleum sosnowskyi TaxID=360622 RepID=A0AAD8MSL1_9APIA|nr:hypothetical protein POM88_016063 [Heracleum sosnowskyi]
MGSEKWPQDGTRKSPRLNKLGKSIDTPVMQRLTTAKRKLYCSSPRENETMGENEVQSKRTIIPPPPPPPTDYEKKRMVRIEYNEQVLYTLVPSLLGRVNSNGPNSNRNDANSDGDASVTPPKGRKKTNKKKLARGRAPTTRSRANLTPKPANEEAREKDETCQFVEYEISPHPDEGQGSMDAWRAMWKRQREQSEKEKARGQEKAGQEKAGASASKKVVEENILPDIEEGDMEDPVPKKMRGKTRMDVVHMRSFDKRVVIGMNDDFQPIAENDKAMWNHVKERYIIPDELENWVLETIHSCWKVYKSRIKADHFTAYENDEMRLANRPDDIALETFKLLLEYWNDESVQARAKKNAASRKRYVDTHTLGPKSFAQHRYKMKKKAVADELEPCDAEVFIETRKRVAGCMYKTNPEIITKKIDNITKKLTTGDTASDELGAKHGPNWLQGRCLKSGMSSSNPPTDTYVKELTTRIKESLASELEEKMKKAESEFQSRGQPGHHS